MREAMQRAPSAPTPQSSFPVERDVRLVSEASRSTSSARHSSLRPQATKNRRTYGRSDGRGLGLGFCVDQIEETAPTNAAEPLHAGPPNDQGLALDIVFRHGAPHATVAAVKAIVPHHEHLALGYLERTEIWGPAAVHVVHDTVGRAVPLLEKRPARLRAPQLGLLLAIYVLAVAAQSTSLDGPLVDIDPAVAQLTVSPPTATIRLMKSLDRLGGR